VKRHAIVRSSLAVLAGAIVLTMMAAVSHAQRGGGGGGGGMPSAQMGGFQLSRLDMLTNDFQLNKDQKKNIKALLDEAHKNSAATRDGLLNSHAAIGTAIAANKSQAEIDAAVKQYGQQAAAMATLEMKALAQLILQLNVPQKGNQAAVRLAFVLMHGIFLDPKKWDKMPDLQSY
jgi:Spy/CpxP family protein refolding chaperone